MNGLFFKLPNEIIIHIYEFDDTYKINYNNCIKEYNFYYKNYARKTSVYESSFVVDNNNYYTKMKLKYEYIDNHLIKDFVKYILFCLKNI